MIKEYQSSKVWPGICPAYCIYLDVSVPQTIKSYSFIGMNNSGLQTIFTIILHFILNTMYVQ